MSDTRSHLILVHAWAPPTAGGTSFVVERVLRDLRQVDLDVWTRATQRSAVRRGSFLLPGRYRFFLKVKSTARLPQPVAWVPTALNVALAVLTGLVIGLVARRQRPTWILSVADEGYSQIAATVAASVSRVPHILWVFDVWEENAYAMSDRRVARWLERRLWRAASAILVHAEELAEHYEHKHGVHAHVLRTPIEEFPLDDLDRPKADRTWEVLVAGSIYWPQAEALARVAEAVRGIRGMSLTVIGEQRLQPIQIAADRYERALCAESLRKRLAHARLLVLGLSFEVPFPEVVRTATPARLPEYVAAGVPLLVHAPATSHVVRHVRRHDLGTVVDIPDVGAVAHALKAIRSDEPNQMRRAERARRFVCAAHGLTAVRAAFLEVLRVVEGRARA